MNCPSCNALLADGADECVVCGVIPSKWRQRPGRTLETRLPPATIVPKRRKGLSLGTSTAVLAAVAIVALLSVVVWFVARRSGALVAKAQSTLASAPSSGSLFDQAFKLPGSPLGLATNGTELLVGQRNAPGGAMRLTREGESFSSQIVAMREPTYEQSISVSTLTWNGTNYIGITTGSWFGIATGDVFTVHDPSTLRVLSTKPAPSGLGGLAWDGQSYWAASRKNTRDADEPAKLYKLDRELKVVATFEPPGVGCQGLAFDGNVLWFADVFSDEISILDVSATPPRVISRSATSLSYLSGIAFYEGHIWVAEYDGGSIRRLANAARSAWLGIQPGAGEAVAASAIGGARRSEEPVDELHRKLRGSDRMDHVSAQMDLDQMKAPVPYDWDTNSADRGPEDADLIEWAVELRHDRVWGNWTIWFGPSLFQGGGQTTGVISVPKFVRYTVTIDPPGDGADIEKEFDVTSSGEHRMLNVELAPADAPGEYEVSLFIHVQYETPDGTARIVNRSYVPLSLRK